MSLNSYESSYGDFGQQLLVYRSYGLTMLPSRRRMAGQAPL